MAALATQAQAWADYSKAEKEALKLLRDAGVSEPPIDPVEISRSVGVAVRFVEFSGESNANVSGFYDFEENAIVVNKDEYPLRQTFTVAHELGHKVLHEAWAKSDKYLVFLRDPSLAVNTPVEQEANCFAANLLMPKFIMDDYYTLPVHELSTLFAVSVPAVRVRLKRLYGI